VVAVRNLEVTFREARRKCRRTDEEETWSQRFSTLQFSLDAILK